LEYRLAGGLARRLTAAGDGVEMKVGLVGYGKMGHGIFSLLSDAPVDVAVFVRNPARAEYESRRLEKRLCRAAGSGVLSAADLPRRLASLRFTSSWEDLRDCGLLVETVSEDYQTKIEVLRQAERMLSPEAVITTNGSSLSINLLAASLRDPTRFCGFHFFHPIRLTTVVEIITSRHTAPGTVDFLRRVSPQIGRRPLVVKDVAGSCINVALSCFCCETLYALEQGLASPSQLDALAGRFARIGPCESLDATGIPFFAEVFSRMLGAFPLDFALPELCHKLIRDGRFGKHVGRGVFLYRDDRPGDDSPEYYVNPCQTHSAGIAPSDEASLYERLLLPIYFMVLYLAQMGLAELSDLCLGIKDLIGMKIDPLQEMQKLGSRGLREVFDRLRRELGPRYDCHPLEGVMASLDGEARRSGFQPDGGIVRLNA
jgi:3-hydroxybutyryl-CoA dehydrogenase